MSRSRYDGSQSSESACCSSGFAPATTKQTGRVQLRAHDSVGDSYGQFSRRNSAAATADRDATRQRQRRPSTARTARSGATVENKTSTHRAIELKPSYRGLFSFSWRRFGSTSGSSWERCDCYRFCSSGIRRSARKAAPCGLARSRVVPRHVGCALGTVLHWTGHASSPRTPMPSRSKVLRRRCQHQR